MDGLIAFAVLVVGSLVAAYWAFARPTKVELPESLTRSGVPIELQEWLGETFSRDLPAIIMVGPDERYFVIVPGFTGKMAVRKRWWQGKR